MWKKIAGLPDSSNGKIIRIETSMDNFWMMGDTGGPAALVPEIFYRPRR